MPLCPISPNSVSFLDPSGSSSRLGQDMAPYPSSPLSDNTFIPSSTHTSTSMTSRFPALTSTGTELVLPSVTSTVKRKHLQTLLKPRFSTSSHPSGPNSPDPTDKKRRLTSGWDELCKATLRAKQVEEDRRASLGARPGSLKATAGLGRGRERKGVRAEGSGLSGTGPFLFSSPIKMTNASGTEHEVFNVDDSSDIEMADQEDETRQTIQAENIVDDQDDDMENYGSSRRKGSLIGMPPTRIGFQKMTTTLKMGKRIPRHQMTTLQDPFQPTNPSYLHQFVSHNMRDAYRVEPNPNHASPTTRDWTSSYACAFSHSAKNAWNRAEGRYAAIGTESGGVRVCDTDKSAVSLDTCWDASDEWAGAGAGSSIRQKPSTNEGEETDEPYQLKEGLYAPHTNAIFDVKWSEDDRRIATASADQSSVVWDTSRIEAGYEGSEKADGMIARLMGHNASVKSCVWYDPNTLASSGRDGHIHIYDLRTSSRHSNITGEQPSADRLKRARGAEAPDHHIWPVLSIKQAHHVVGRKRHYGPGTESSTVTSLVPLKSNMYHLASGSSMDGVIKLWDLRTSKTRKFLTQPVQCSEDRTLETSSRSRGIIHMVEAVKSGMIYSLDGGSHITAYSTHDLSTRFPLTYYHPDLVLSNFYLKLSISPCERYISCGGKRGALFAWETGQHTRKHLDASHTEEKGGSRTIRGVLIAKNGHSRELSASDWAHDRILTCSDDYTSRIWRPSRANYEALRRDPVEASFDWAGFTG